MNQKKVRPHIKISLCVLLAAAALMTQTACPAVPFSGTDFRNQALPAIENGVDSILDGLVDGIFAAIRTESDSNGQAGNP